MSPRVQEAAVPVSAVTWPRSSWGEDNIHQYCDHAAPRGQADIMGAEQKQISVTLQHPTVITGEEVV